MSERNLSNIAICQDLSQEEVERLSKRCHWATYHTHDMIIDYDDDLAGVYFIVKGAVRVVIRTEGFKEIVLTELREGDVFGEMAAIDGDLRSANVMATEDTLLGVIGFPAFCDALSDYPALSLSVMRLLTGRLRATNQRMAEYTFLDAKNRLYNELLKLSRPRKNTEGERIVSPPPVQKELADRIGCRREVISRELARLKKEEIADQQRGGLVIMRPDILSKRVSEAWRK